MTPMLLLLACGSDGPPAAVAPNDLDGDGYTQLFDCDDEDAQAHPGAADPFYDGVDSACDGGDDFDQDGDGYAWSFHGGADCNDLDPEVGPHAVELPYDSIDNDCDTATSDDDLDADGSPWPFDCDDANPDIGDGFLERFGDGIDEDCDGLEDGTTLEMAPYEFINPRGLRLVGFEGEALLALHADQASGHAPEPTQVDAQLGLTLHPTTLDLPVVFQGGFGEVDALAAIDVAVDEEGLWFGVATESGATGARRLASTRFERIGNDLLRIEVRDLGLGSGAPLTAVDIHVDRAGEPWVVGGNDELVAWMGGNDESSGTAAANASGGVAVLPDSVPPLPFMSCDGDGCLRWVTGDESGPPIQEGAPPFDGASDALHGHSDILVVQHPIWGMTAHIEGESYELLLDEPLVHANAAYVGGVLYAAGVTTDGRVVITHGSPTWSVLERVEMRLPSPDFDAKEVAVWADDDRFVVAVAADTNDFDLLRGDRVFWKVMPRARD